MTPECTPSKSRLLLIWLVNAAAMFSVSAMAADAPAAMTPTTDSQREAAAVLKGMGEYLANLKTLTCSSRNGYEVVQANGQKIEFGETRLISLSRPDRLRIEEVSSDGRSDLALFDGKQMTVFNADAGVYAQAPQPGSVDDAIVYFVRDLHMRMPLAMMLSTHVRTEIAALVTELDYVESTDIYGMAAHHIAGRTDSVDFQFWIAEGERPLPLRVVITYRNETGQPQFWSDISDWNTSPALTESTFDLKLPKDARKIAFAVQISEAGEAKP